MARVTDLDRRKPLPSNHIFEAHDDHDPTQDWFLQVFADPTDTGAQLCIVQDDTNPEMLSIKHLQWLSPAQCREFGEALVRFADKADAAEPE